ncbi:cyclin-dependent kinase 20-like [Choloepus didactylus]|uniref:cyclin-dependent kinase 20-like n=1 Tax=Choloepus didactylus TaxID=27675 RepID=UPI0018A02384|nr:cyclin-dependent kinase 20-like [Choloepus didactylus]
MDQYCILGRIGEGAHGIVFKAKHVETGEIVALKKVALRRLEDGIPNQALREIKALQEMEDNQYVSVNSHPLPLPIPMLLHLSKHFYCFLRFTPFVIHLL